MGICLGMQLLFERSFEYGEHAGLGYLPGSVVPLSEAFARELGASLHVRKLAGRNSHHIIEAAFKGLGRAMRAAVSIDDARDQAVPSTKGTIL